MKNRIFVFLEGGFVSAVVAAEPMDLEVVIVNYDTDGIDPDELIQVHQYDDRFEPALAHVESIERAGVDFNHIVEQLENKR